MKYQIWECKLVVPIEAELPAGFDSAPREAARQAVEQEGIKVVGIFSGWGGQLTEYEAVLMDGWEKK